MPVNHHSGGGTPDFGMHPPASTAMFMLEVTWWAHRPLWHLMFAGVFERHPNLHFCNTESGTKWMLDDPARARQLLRPDEVRPRLRGVLRGRGDEGHVAAPERVLAPPVPRRRELPAARSSAISATRSGSRTSCGASTTRTTRGRSRTRACTCGARSRACRRPRSSRWSRSTRRSSTSSTSTRSRRSRSGSARRRPRSSSRSRGARCPRRPRSAPDCTPRTSRELVS